MRNGSYIRALGRMSFEPSPAQTQRQPTAVAENETSDASNSQLSAAAAGSASPDGENMSPTSQIATSSNRQPPSRELQSNLILAQNDVLATVGVCLRESQMRPDEETLNQVMRENEVGVYVGAVDLTATYLIGWPLVSIRNRIQTFRTFGYVRFVDILRLARHKHHSLDPFIGMPAHLTFQACTVFTDFLSSRFLLWIMKTEFFRDPRSGQLRKYSKITIRILDIGLQLFSWCLFFPLYEHSTLQSLNLTPPFPLLPPLKSFRLLPSHAESHTGIFPIWIPQVVLRMVDSYVVISFMQSQIYQKIHDWCFTRISRRLLPRPTNPDQASLLAADMELEVEGDNEEEGRRERRRRRRSTNLRPSRSRNNSNTQPQGQEQEESTVATAGATDHHSDSLTEWDVQWLTDEGEVAADSAVEAEIQIDNDGPQPSDEAGNVPNEPVEDTVEGIALEDIAFLPIGTHLPEVETAIPIHPPRSSSLMTTPAHHHNHHHNHDFRPTPTPNRSQHRMTTLSCHPCDAAATHIADAIATGLTTSIESIVLRSIARQFLVRQPNSTARSWHIEDVYSPRDVYHPRRIKGQWHGVIKGFILEYIVTWSLWEATYWASTWLGLGMFGYHSV